MQKCSFSVSFVQFSITRKCNETSIATSDNSETSMTWGDPEWWQWGHKTPAIVGQMLNVIVKKWQDKKETITEQDVPSTGLLKSETTETTGAQYLTWTSNRKLHQGRRYTYTVCKTPAGTPDGLRGCFKHHTVSKSSCTSAITRLILTQPSDLVYKKQVTNEVIVTAFETFLLWRRDVATTHLCSPR